MINAEKKIQQNILGKNQLNEFYVDHFAEEQLIDFFELTGEIIEKIKVAVDVGGGCGYFARRLAEKIPVRVRVLDSDKVSIDACLKLKNNNIEAQQDDALQPTIIGDEDIVCFNLILHHLITNNEKTTNEIQKKAVNVWSDSAKFIFINEYCYDSYFFDFSAKIIFLITKNKFLSFFCKLISVFIPSLKANTFGVGVRFRSHDDWLNLFGESNYHVLRKKYGRNEDVSFARRFLLIKNIRKDSFLLIKR